MLSTDTSLVGLISFSASGCLLVPLTTFIGTQTSNRSGFQNIGCKWTNVFSKTVIFLFLYSCKAVAVIFYVVITWNIHLVWSLCIMFALFLKNRLIYLFASCITIYLYAVFAVIIILSITLLFFQSIIYFSLSLILFPFFKKLKLMCVLFFFF